MIFLLDVLLDTVVTLLTVKFANKMLFCDLL